MGNKPSSESSDKRDRDAHRRRRRRDVCPEETRDTIWEELDASNTMKGFYSKIIKDPDTQKQLRVTCPKHARCLEIKDDDKYWFGQCGGIKENQNRERRVRFRYRDDYYDRRSVDSRDDDKHYQEVFAYPMISELQNGSGRRSRRYRKNRISSPSLISLKRSQTARFSFPLIRRFEPQD